MTEKRLEELAAAWSTDDPDPTVRSELEDRLRTDPAARRQFLDHCVAEMALVESLASAANAHEEGAKGIRGSRRLRSHKLTRNFPTLPIAWVAAGLAALIVVAIMLIPTRHTMLVTAGSLVTDGRTVANGEHVQLPLIGATAGTAGVEFNDPTGIALQVSAATKFAITSPGRIELEAGKLSLEVDGSRAPPTTVHTDELVVNVVGTRFNIERSSVITNVEVEQGHVRIITPDNTVRELTSGMRIAADDSGFISPKEPVSDQVPTRELRLLYIAEDLTQRMLERLDQPIRIPADRPFTLRAEVDAAVVALGYRLSGTQDLPQPPKRVEEHTPYDLWGDQDQQPLFYPIPAGNYHLTITYFADTDGDTAIATRQFTVIAE